METPSLNSRLTVKQVQPLGDVSRGALKYH
jgi:hypothetical protein